MVLLMLIINSLRILPPVNTGGDALQRVFMTSSGNRNFDILMNFILFSHVLNLGRVLDSITGLDIRVNTAGLTD